MYYRAMLNGEEVLLIVTPDTDAPDPLTYSDPVTDHRPLFVLMNHMRYSFGDLNAERTAWELIKRSAKWNPDWEEEYLWDTEKDAEGYRVENPNFLEQDDGLQSIVRAAERIDALCVPVYMYDHSGISLSLCRSYPFNCPWDSGILGVILWTKEERDFYMSGLLPDDERTDMELLEEWFDKYDAYVGGEVYCIQILNPVKELSYLASKRNHSDDDLTLADLNQWELEFIAAHAPMIDSCGDLYDTSNISAYATDYFGVTDVEPIE